MDSQARYEIVLKDAITGQRITDSLSITFTGDAALKAADGTSLNGKTITTTDGLVGLGATFSASAKDFSVLAGNRTLGWLETGTRVVGDTSVTGDRTLELRLVNTNKAASVNASPESVAMRVATVTTTASGALAGPVTLVTAPKTVTNAEGMAETIGSASLALKAGTTGRAADGTVAAAGPLTVSATLFSNASVGALLAFPGGFAASVTGAPASLLNGTTASDVAFITGGFAQFSVTDSTGKAIRNFDQPINVSIDLPKTSLDINGNPVLAGSEYPVWSYDDATGKWKFERMGTVSEKSPVDPNNYTVAFSTNHLSAWNLDFATPSCTAQINLTGRPVNDERQLAVEVSGVAGQRFGRIGYMTDSQLSIYRAPVNVKVNVKVRDQGVVVGRASNVLLCTAANQPNPLTVPMTLLPIAVGTVIRVDTSESCANGSQKRALPTFAWVNVNNAGNWRVGYTLPVAGAPVARKDFRTVVAGTSTAYAYNPRNSRYESQSVTVTANNTATAAFNFIMSNCSTGPTGGSE
ncbi:MAG: hypothetical protein I8H91_04840 [Burkholderiales bacterium]|nr:hypothetical protein [Burkholderiales bacterium]